MNRLTKCSLASIDFLIISGLSIRLSEKVIEWYGSDARLQKKPDIQVRTWSFLLRYKVSFSTKSAVYLIVKIPRRPDMESLDRAIESKRMRLKAKDKYNKMVTIENLCKWKNDRFCYIKSMDYIIEYNAIVMEKLPCYTVKEFLFRPQIILGIKKSWEQLEQISLRAGQWLFMYHNQATEAKIKYLTVDELEQTAKQIVDSLDEVTHYQIDISFLKTGLSRLISSFCPKDLKCTVTSLHGDFNCSNILVTKNNLVGALDTSDMSGVIYRDIAKITTDPAIWKEQIITNGLLLRVSQIERIKLMFLDGYFAEETVHDGLLRFYSIDAIAQKWTNNEEKLTNFEMFPKILNLFIQYRMRSYFRRILERYL